MLNPGVQDPDNVGMLVQTKLASGPLPDLLDAVGVVLQGLLELLAAGSGLLPLLLLVVEGEQLGADLDHHQEAHLNTK